MMTLREFLLRLSLCECLTRRRKYLLFLAVMEQKQITDLLALADHTRMNFTTRSHWLDEWASLRIDDLAKENRRLPFITLVDDLYPQRLREIYDPPLVLYYRGNLSLLKTPTVAVVGSRKMSSYGERVINEILPGVISSGVTIISGLAQGIDGMAHRLCLADGGATIGVIGTGLDETYPRQHAALQQTIAYRGLLLTEYPLHTPPRSRNFPERNRILAGLCHTCLVIEGGKRSGSLITANLALQDNRNVCAVPGPIDSRLSVGTNELILAGAKPILCTQDLLEELPDWTFLPN